MHEMLLITIPASGGSDPPAKRELRSIGKL